METEQEGYEIRLESALFLIECLEADLLATETQENHRGECLKEEVTGEEYLAYLLLERPLPDAWKCAARSVYRRTSDWGLWASATLPGMLETPLGFYSVFIEKPPLDEKYAPLTGLDHDRSAWTKTGNMQYPNVDCLKHVTTWRGSNEGYTFSAIRQISNAIA